MANAPSHHFRLALLKSLSLSIISAIEHSVVAWYIYTTKAIREGTLNKKSEPTKQLHIRLPSDIYKKLRVKCVHDDISMQSYVARLIKMSLDNSTKGNMEIERKISNTVNSQ